MLISNIMINIILILIVDIILQMKKKRDVQEELY